MLFYFSSALKLKLMSQNWSFSSLKENKKSSKHAKYVLTVLRVYPQCYVFRLQCKMNSITEYDSDTAFVYPRLSISGGILIHFNGVTLRRYYNPCLAVGSTCLNLKRCQMLRWNEQTHGAVHGAETQTDWLALPAVVSVHGAETLTQESSF